MSSMVYRTIIAIYNSVTATDIINSSSTTSLTGDSNYNIISSARCRRCTCAIHTTYSYAIACELKMYLDLG